MELEQMKAIWSDMSERLDRQQKITDQLILRMAYEKSGSRLNRIMIMEAIGIIVVIGMILYLLFRFDRLENWLQVTGGIGTLLILLASILFGVRIIRKARKIDLIRNTYQQTLLDFNDLKKTLKLYKKVSIGLNVVMPFFILPVFFKLFLEKDLLADFSSYGGALLTTALLVPPLLYIVIKYYGKMVSQIRKSLDEAKPDE